MGIISASTPIVLIVVLTIASNFIHFGLVIGLKQEFSDHFIESYALKPIRYSAPWRENVESCLFFRREMLSGLVRGVGFEPIFTSKNGW